MNLKNFLFMLLLLGASFLIGCGNGSNNNQHAKSENSMKKETNAIPEDIVLRLKHDFENEEEFKEALKMINHVRQDTLNVGWVQLSRSIILIADGNINEMQKIIESNYYGDPRDVIMTMMGIPGNSNNHGMTPFETKK